MEKPKVTKPKGYIMNTEGSSTLDWKKCKQINVLVPGWWEERGKRASVANRAIP